MRLSMLFLATVVVLALSANGFPSERQIEMRWSELGPFLQDGRLIGNGAKAMLMLPDGTILEGHIVGVEEEQIELNVSKSSNKQEFTTGRISIPRSSITTIRLTQTKGYGRALLTTAGIVGGLMLGAVVAVASDEGANAAAGVAVLATPVGAGIGGYYAGRHLDRKTTIINILRE